MERKELKTAVVCGGISTEREISLNSGKAVYEALKEYGYKDVTLFDLTKDNLSKLLSGGFEVAFLVLHGYGGEDGCIQGALELSGIPYTGPGVEASAVCMNKILTKRLIKAANLPTADFEVVHKNDYNENTENSLVEKLGLPMVLKAPRQGSSIGVVIVKTKEEMQSAVKEIFTYDSELLAEKFIDGTETTLPVIGNDTPQILPDIEITSEREFYDYKAKYTNGLCHHIIPARIDDVSREDMKKIGEKVYRTLGCRGISRIDFIIDKQGNPMVMEVNTIPGMTEMSLVPDSARYAGMTFGELCDKLIGYALEK